MKSYVPNTVAEREEMLKTIGLDSMDQLPWISLLP